MKHTATQTAALKSFRAAAKGIATVTATRLESGALLIRAAIWDRKEVSTDAAKMFHASASRWHYRNEVGAVIA
jgi:hypothetical protein